MNNSKVIAFPIHRQPNIYQTRGALALAPCYEKSSSTKIKRQSRCNVTKFPETHGRFRIRSRTITKPGRCSDQRRMNRKPISKTVKALKTKHQYQLIHQRWYDPETRRFISADPALTDPARKKFPTNNENIQPLDFHTYQFARNNPIKFGDPTGLASKQITKQKGIVGLEIKIVKGTLFDQPFGRKEVAKQVVMAKSIWQSEAKIQIKSVSPKVNFMLDAPALLFKALSTSIAPDKYRDVNLGQFAKIKNGVSTSGADILVLFTGTLVPTAKQARRLDLYAGGARPDAFTDKGMIAFGSKGLSGTKKFGPHLLAHEIGHFLVTDNHTGKLMESGNGYQSPTLKGKDRKKARESVGF